MKIDVNVNGAKIPMEFSEEEIAPLKAEIRNQVRESIYEDFIDKSISVFFSDVLENYKDDYEFSNEDLDSIQDIAATELKEWIECETDCAWTFAICLCNMVKEGSNIVDIIINAFDQFLEENQKYYEIDYDVIIPCRILIKAKNWDDAQEIFNDMYCSELENYVICDEYVDNEHHGNVYRQDELDYSLENSVYD